MNLLLNVGERQGARVHLHSESLDFLIVGVSLGLDASVLLVQVPELAIGLDYGFLGVFDGSLALRYGLFELLDPLEGALISFSLEEGLFGQSIELALHLVTF